MRKQEETSVRHRKRKRPFEVRLVNDAFGEQIAELRRRRAEDLIARLSNGLARRLNRGQVIDRANMERLYKNKKVFVRSRSGDKEFGEFFCLGFDAPHMHARCVDQRDRLHVFNPDEVWFETRAERTLRFAKERSVRLSKRIAEIKKVLSELEIENKRVVRMVQRANSAMKRERGKEDLRRFLEEDMEIRRLDDPDSDEEKKN